jgi:hypothetical protein
MKLNLLKTCCLAMFLLFSACAVPPEKPPELSRQAVADALPGAVVSEDGLQISYPDNSLFAEGSVLPLPGGMAVLEPLVNLLNNNRQFKVAVMVRSNGHDEEYDKLLATKRMHLLETIFINRGLEKERLQMSVVTGAGAPLELALQPLSAERSSGEKR